MATSGKGTATVGYNVQIAVDVEHHLIVAHFGDHGQRAITLPLIFEPVFANEDGVGLSAPLTH
jgi:hypothetical protein